MKLTRISEDTGICNHCRKNEHERCQKLAGTSQGDYAYCTCQCSGLGTSLGAPEGAFNKIPTKIKKEFPRHEADPLGHIF
jgi:hypothetical protein